MQNPLSHANSTMPPGERHLRARLAAFSLHSQVDSRAHTLPARTAFLSNFAAQVDPEGVLPVAERERRAGCARRAYFTRLALKSAQARRRRAARKNGGAGDD
jgi:hypothetical protein